MFQKIRDSIINTNLLLRDFIDILNADFAKLLLMLIKKDRNGKSITAK